VPHPVRLWAAAMVLTAAPIAPVLAQQPEHFELAGSDITLSNLIGTVRVEAASGAIATAEVTRQGADGAKLTVRQSGGKLSVVFPGKDFVYPALGGNYESSIRVQDDGSFSGDWADNGGRTVKISARGTGLTAWADIRLLIPAGARVSIKLGVGKVSLANVDGTIEVNTANGDVEGKATTGALSIDTGSGDVTLTGHKGGLTVDTGSGDISLAGVTTDLLSLDTGSGDVLVTGAAVRVIRVDTGSGDVRIELTGDIDELSVDTGSGDVEVSAPKSLGAAVSLETSSGDITTDFPIQVTRKSGDGLTGTIGDGKGRMSIETASGDVRLRQRP